MLANKTNYKKLHVLGKIEYVEDPFTCEELIVVSSWNKGNEVRYRLEKRLLKSKCSAELIKESKDEPFIIECEAIVDKNNVLHDIEICAIYEPYANKRTLEIYYQNK